MGIRKAGLPSPIAAFWFEQFIGTFHVKIFLFVSGYLYHIRGDWRSQGTRIHFLCHKIMNLGIPYVIFSILYILMNFCVGKTNTNFLLSDIFSIWKIPVAQYWFLYSLLLLFVLWTILSLWMKNLTITIVMTLAALLLNTVNLPMYEGIRQTLPCVLSFGLGSCMSEHAMGWVYEKARSWYGLVLVVLHLATISLYPVVGGENYLFSQVTSLLGIGASIVVVLQLQKIRFVERILLWITKYSFVIYLLHTIFTAAIRIFLMILGVDQYWIHVLCGYIAGMAIPVCGAILCQKMKIYDYLFAPSKVLTRR